jgi:hypothetical protein
MPFAVTESGKKLKTKNEKKKKKWKQIETKKWFAEKHKWRQVFLPRRLFPEPKMATKNMNVSLIKKGHSRVKILYITFRVDKMAT